MIPHDEYESRLGSSWKELSRRKQRNGLLLGRRNKQRGSRLWIQIVAMRRKTRRLRRRRWRRRRRKTWYWDDDAAGFKVSWYTLNLRLGWTVQFSSGWFNPVFRTSKAGLGRSERCLKFVRWPAKRNWFGDTFRKMVNGEVKQRNWMGGTSYRQGTDPDRGRFLCSAATNEN